ncbi:MAG: hypothetical protein Q9216_001111 [Gyalolechia sp. 2 TL-2023]
MAKSTSPVPSPSEASDDDPSDGHEGQCVSHQQSQNGQPSPSQDTAATDSQSPRVSATLPKRRRVTRACDESLENRLQRAEQLLREIRPDVTLDDPKYDAIISQRIHAPIKVESQSPANVPTSSGSQPTFSQAVAKAEDDSLLESMVHEAGSLALDDQGHWDFYGHSSGMIFLQRMREQFGTLLGKSENRSLFFNSPSLPERFNSPRSASASPMNPGLTNVHDLPAKACAQKLCSCALDDAAALLRFVHQPSFYESFNRVYETPPEEFTPTDQGFLPLLYSVLALGCLFARSEESMLQSYGYESAIDQGDEDIDQDFPLEVDDEYITADAVLPMPPGQTSPMTAFNAHIWLVKLLAKTVRYVYPLQTSRSTSKHAYVVNYVKIREVEQDLHRWMEDLPMALRPGGETPPELIRVQQLLRIAYGHIQIMLYRPFLHYASQSIQSMKTDKRSYACAAACISVSRNIVHITSEMKRRGLLSGAYWFTMYTTFFATLSLLFYVVENPHNAASHGILRDAHEGRDTLASLASRSIAADRSSQSLKASRKRATTALCTNGLPRISLNIFLKQLNQDDSILQWSSPSYGTEDPDPIQPSRTYKSPTTPHQNAPSLEPAATTGTPQQAFSTFHEDTVGFQPSGMTAGNVPQNAMQPVYPTPDTTRMSGLPDLSTMMFPSNDPFAYPNQPMTILENLQGSNPDQTFSSQLFDNSANHGSYNNLNAPLYGPLPPYPMQGMRSTGAQVDGEPRGFDGSQWWAQQPQGGFAPPAGSGWDTIFGEDWSGGWTDLSYTQ